MGKAIRVAYGETLVELGQVNDKIVVFDADLANATMTSKFKEKFPDRFYDLGIAECNMMGAAAAFAREGLTPFASTFAIFGAGRAFEIIRNSIAYTNLNVKIALTHAGLSVGEDGGSHQSVEDIALMRSLPNMTVIVPCDAIEARKAVIAASEMKGPVYIRLARPVVDDITNVDTEFEIGKANVLKEGTDVCIISTGLMVSVSLNAAYELEKQGISTSVVDMHTIKPIDKKLILDMNKNKKMIITVEEHSIIGGLGSAVAEVLAGNPGAKFAMVGINDKFGHSGLPDQLFEEYGLTAENVVNTVIKNIK